MNTEQQNVVRRHFEELRQKKNLSLRKSAKGIGIDVSSLSKMLKEGGSNVEGGRNLSRGFVEKAAKFFEVSTDYLTSDREKQKKQESLGNSLTWNMRKAPEDGGESGGDAAEFAFSFGIESTIDELVDNEVDQRLDGVKQGESKSDLHVEITLVEMTKTSPEYREFCASMRYDQFGRHLSASAGADFVESARLKTHIEELENADRIYALRISGFGSTGLYGPEFSKDDPDQKYPFSSLVRDVRRSAKKSPTGAGSHGLGSKKAFSASGLNLVLYSSEVAKGLYKENDKHSGKLRFIGKTQLVAHTSEGTPWEGVGWLSDSDEKSKYKSVWVEPEQLEGLRLSRKSLLPEGVLPSGTSLLIVHLQDKEDIDPPRVLADIYQACAKNFWPALTMADPDTGRPRLSIVITHELNGKETQRTPVDPRSSSYAPFVEAYEAHLLGNIVTTDAEPGDTIRDSFGIIIPESVKDPADFDEPHRATKAEAQLLVRYAIDDDPTWDPNISPKLLGRVATIRGPLTVVQYRDYSKAVLGGKGFHGILLTGNAVNDSKQQTIFDQFLRISENPEHNKWEFEGREKHNYGRASGAKARLKEMWQEIKELIGKHARPDRSEEGFRSEFLEKLFSVPGGQPIERVAKMKQKKLKYVDGRWELEGKVGVNQKGEDFEGQICLEIVPERLPQGGKKTRLTWESFKVVKVVGTKNQRVEVVDPETGSFKESGRTTSFSVQGRTTRNVPGFPDLSRVAVSPYEKYTLVNTGEKEG